MVNSFHHEMKRGCASRATCWGCVVAVLFASGRVGRAQVEPGVPTYRLHVAVDEVSVTFHAIDVRGLPIDDLKLDEVKLLDSGKPPREVLAFQFLRDFPLRAGILMDTSVSMVGTRAIDRGIALLAVRRLVRQQADRAFVLNFNRLSGIPQPWTADTSVLGAGIRNWTGGPEAGSRMGGTALLDAIYGACLNQFGHLDGGAGVNVILLFSDGDDNASHDSLQQTVEMCQRSNTPIYAFHPVARSVLDTGPATLKELSAESGGRIFPDSGSEEETENDLRIIEADLRGQYRIRYKPPALERDGRFHRVEFTPLGRVGRIESRSGYYAPQR